MSEHILNLNNTGWKTGKYPLLLGEPLGLHDTINIPYPDIEKMYHEQKKVDWTEFEIPLAQSKIDMIERAPKYVVDLMVKNLSYQWEFDSIASRSFAVLLAPFISNSEWWRAQVKFMEIETTHSSCYSEIVKQCIPDVNQVITQITENEKIRSRMSVVENALEELRIAGHKYGLGMIENNQELFNIVFKSVWAMYLAERLQFMSSFPATFICAEQGYFIDICKLVQKIAIDELQFHAHTFNLVLRNLIRDEPRAKIALEQIGPELKQIYDETIENEKAWAKYLFSEGRKVVGLTYPLLCEYVDYHAHYAGLTLGYNADKPAPKNPLPWMERWLNIDMQQNANQEASQSNYVKVFVQQTLRDDEEL